LTTITNLYRERRWQALATLLCILFGIAFIANIHPIGDGLWFWYATSLRGGHLLYADMHLPLQPLFVLLTVWSQQLFGTGWVASKVLAIAQLVTYVVALWLINDFVPWKDWQKAILIASVFGMTITAFYFRFDDYHITGYCFEVYSIYLLLRLRDEVSLRYSLSAAAIMGILSGLSIGNRLNDGTALFAACGFTLPFFVRSKKILALTIFCVAALLTVLAVIGLTGDSVHNWALNSIIRAAAIKGGTGHVLYAPLTFPFTITKYLLTSWRVIANLLYACLLSAICVLMLRFIRRPDGRLWISRIACGVGLILLSFPFAVRQANVGMPNASIAAVGVLVSFALTTLVLVRLFRALFLSPPPNWNVCELLLLIPFLQLLAGAMTSGQSLLEVYPAVAVLLLLLPISSPIRVHTKWQRASYIAIAAWLAVSTLILKTAHPYKWHHFMDRTMFVDRQWYRHPVYGPMYIERDQLQFIESVCADINKDGATTQLLSITNPYANYFCNVAPWHGYVQTWYDTTSQQTINTLMSELQTAPPHWIIYQRGLDTMALHELVFTSGRPLPHRALDRFIMDKITQGKWLVARRQKFQDADWILIRTHS
jgi:hypothetical protein